jgi:hypothetical protein
MRNVSVAFATAGVLAFASPSMAGLIGSSVTGTASATGTVQVSPTALGTTTVGAGPEFSFCLGPPLACAMGSGISAGVDITDTGVDFSFFGSTAGAHGTFSVLLSGFGPTIENVTLASNGFDSFALTSFGPHQMLFTGATTNDFNAIGGQFANFAVVSAAPEPATLALLGIALAGIGFSRRRKAN